MYQQSLEPQENQAFFPQQAYGAPQDGFWQQQAHGAPGNYGSVGEAFPDAPQERMNKEERKQAKKDEKEKDKYDRLLRMRKKRDLQASKDSKRFVLGFCVILLLLGLLLVLSMFGEAWSYKRFIGTGIGVLTLRTSLLYIDVSLRCDKSFFLENWLCKNIFNANDINGIHALRDTQAHMCAVPGIGQSACAVMAHAYYSNFVIIIAFSLAALCQLLAAFFLWNYYNTLHHRSYRIWATSLTVAGPILAVSGLALWAAIFPDLGAIPYSVNAMAGALLGGNGLLGFQELHGLAFGWTFFAALFMCFLMMMQCLVWYCFFVRQDDEEEIALKDEEEQEFIEHLEAYGWDAPEVANAKESIS